MVKDPETGRLRGFAYMAFTTQAALLEAIDRMDRYEIKGRAISLREVKDRAARYPTPPSPHQAEAAVAPEPAALGPDDAGRHEAL
jgi:RNA recognition motif-containing protein